MKNISFIITLFFIVSLSSLEKISAQPYTIKRLGMEDGLSSNYTQKIIQDQKGYIWVATSSGLNRFDGQKFILYGQDNHKTEQNWINGLLADPTNDNVWVGTDQGLFYFDYPTGSMMPHATPLSHLDKNITGLTAATDSGIWITHHTAGVIHWSAQDTTCYTPQTVLGLKGPFQTAVDDGNGNLYIGHSDKGLSIVSIKNNFCKNYRHIPGNQNSLPDNSVNVIYKDKSHNIWLGTNNGLVLFNPQKESFTTFRQMEDNEHSLLGNQVADIKQMNDGTLWISTYLGGVSIFNLLENTFTPPAQAIFTRITASNDGHGLSSPNAQSIIQDSFGNIWIGNYRGGIDFISHTQPLFNTITYKTEKYGHNCNKQVWGLWADNNRQIWLGGEGELGIYKEGKEIEIIPLNQCRLNKQTHISVIHQDKHGDLWLGTHKHGVAIYHPDTKRITCIGDDKDGSLDILCFYEDTDGKIWIGTQSGLYSAYNRELTQEDKINRLLTNKGIRSILKDKNGKLWIGAKGLFLFDDKGQLFQELTTEQSFPIRSVNYLMEDSRKRIWVGTNDGILVSEMPAIWKIIPIMGRKKDCKTPMYAPYRKTMTEPSGSVPMPVFHDWTKRQRLSTITTTMTEYPWETLWTDLPAFPLTESSISVHKAEPVTLLPVKSTLSVNRHRSPSHNFLFTTNRQKAKIQSIPFLSPMPTYSSPIIKIHSRFHSMY